MKCAACGCEAIRGIDLDVSDSGFFDVLCPTCWNLETEDGKKRDFDFMEGFVLKDLYDAEGAKIDPQQTEFEASMLTGRYRHGS